MPIGEYCYNHVGAVIGAVSGGLTGSVLGESTGLKLEEKMEQALVKLKTNTSQKLQTMN